MFNTKLTKHNLIILMCMFSIILVSGYLYLRYMIFDLVDELWEDDGFFIVKNNCNEYKIPLYDVSHVSCTFTPRRFFPERVTLHLLKNSNCGAEVAFTPIESWLPIEILNTELDKLTSRIDKYKNDRVPTKLDQIKAK